MNRPAAHPSTRWDVFCKLVDNFGDIGVCWRLARVLSAHHGISVRLWIDCPEAFFKLEPGLKKQPLPLQLGRVEVCEWRNPFPSVEAAEVVIEAFACELPTAYVAAMARRPTPPVWVELDYLTAEAWVSECHGLGSPHPPSGLLRFFFFPGFEPNTGGLLREPGLFDERDRVCGAPQARADFLTSMGLVEEAAGALLVSLFSYENAAIPELLKLWADGTQAVLLLVPEGRALTSVATFLGESRLCPGDCRTRGRLTLRVLPFSDQATYDRLLWICDLNFVRGEDSFVRAQWAAKPFIWHIYPQDEAAHLIKLEAFLSRYDQPLDEASAAALRSFSLQWNGEQAQAEAWPRLAAALPALAEHARQWADGLAKQTDLATRLVHFCQKRL